MLTHLILIRCTGHMFIRQFKNIQICIQNEIHSSYDEKQMRKCVCVYIIINEYELILFSFSKKPQVYIL